MTTANPAGEMILENLHKAIGQLRDDVTRVEIWANALQTFARPVPEYDPGNSRYALRAQGQRSGAQALHEASKD